MEGGLKGLWASSLDQHFLVEKGARGTMNLLIHCPRSVFLSPKSSAYQQTHNESDNTDSSCYNQRDIHA
jgi:hypothetical protein